MIFLRTCAGLVVCSYGLTVPGALGQIAASEPQGTASQQQSIARQMEAISSISALRQAESFRQQAESLRRQTGNSQTIVSVSENPAPGAPAKPRKEAADLEKQTAAPTQTSPSNPNNLTGGPQSTAADAYSGFYTTPWPASPDFIMPNVQVETSACEALDSGQVDSLVKEASTRNKLDPALLRAVMVQESGFKPCAVSTAGAMGLMQIMPETADDLSLADPFDPASNVDAGARYLKQMLDRYHGNRALALAAYNAGPGRTDKANGIPPISETIGYVSHILGNIPLY